MEGRGRDSFSLCSRRPPPSTPVLAQGQGLIDWSLWPSFIGLLLASVAGTAAGNAVRPYLSVRWIKRVLYLVVLLCGGSGLSSCLLSPIIVVVVIISSPLHSLTRTVPTRPDTTPRPLRLRRPRVHVAPGCDLRRRRGGVGSGVSLGAGVERVALLWGPGLKSLSLCLCLALSLALLVSLALESGNAVITLYA